MINLETATFAGGCFWCTEAIFKRIKGVDSVIPGYAGDGKPNPTYEEVSSGSSGYTESLQIKFNPEKVSYLKLLEIFFKTHDPTSYDKQGEDIGSQYRSIIFYYDNQQQKQTEDLIKKLDEAQIFNKKIITEVLPFAKFYEAETYHKNFYDKNKDDTYCTVVINPKLEKLYKEFSDSMKTTN